MPWEMPVDDKTGVFGKLAALFAWRDNLYPKLSGTIQPVVEVVSLSGEDKLINKALNLTGATNTEVTDPVFKVPKGERWELKFARNEGLASNGKLGFYKNGVSCLMRSASNSDAPFDMYGAELKEGDYFYWTGTANASDSSRACFLMVRRYILQN
jgi:hypothetical protein